MSIPFDKYDISLEKALESTKNLLTKTEKLPIENPEPEFPYPFPDIDIMPILKSSERTLPGFVTLDASLATAIDNIQKSIQNYVDDKTRRRPYNVLMLAEPGSGKSHLVNCLAKSLNIPHVTGNLSALDNLGVLTYVVNEARNYKAQDRVPLIFLDEVDNNQSNYSALLPLLWDGELFVSGQAMKLGRCIIICAASKQGWVGSYLDNKERTKTGIQSLKLPDFFSRFNGGIFEIHSLNDESRKLDKLVISVKLILRRFPEVKYVSLGFLQFFCYLNVEHDVRSLEFLIDLVPSDSEKARPSDVGGKSTIKPKEKFISLHKNWNEHLLYKFNHIFQEDGDLIDIVRFHISEQNRVKAKKAWMTYVNNIGLVKISDS
ncbi:MAG: AAA family ATPase [Dehalococcoidales bacterium]